MFTTIHWYCPEAFLMIASGWMITFVAIRPEGFGNTSLSIFLQKLAQYTLIIYGIIVVSSITELYGIRPLTGLIFIVLAVAGAIYTNLMKGFHNPEFSVLVIWAILGMDLILSANDLLMLYLGLEVQSLTLYIMATLQRNGEYSTEAGFKYFLLGAVSSGLFLLGSAYTYLVAGHIGYAALSELSLDGISNVLGGTLIITALLWKMGAAPLHMWVPDVYEGAPTIVTAFFAILPKISILFALSALLVGPFLGEFLAFRNILIISALLSMLIGAIGALNQSKLKRILAYSAISHTGFLLAGLAAGSLNGLIASLFYVCLYIVMSFFSFSLLLALFPGSSNYLDQLLGLSRQNKVLALSFGFILLSLAGVPPLAGFYSKFLVLSASLQADLFILTGVAIFSSMVSAFFYLRILKYMYFKDSGAFNWKVLADISSDYFPPINLSKSLILGGSLFIVITALIYPTPLLALTTDAILSNLI